MTIIPNIPTSVKNWKGQDIHVGDTVIYPFTSGSSAHVAEGKVTAIQWPKSEFRQWMRDIKEFERTSDETGYPDWLINRGKRMKPVLVVEVSRDSSGWKRTRPVVHIGAWYHATRIEVGHAR